MAPPALTADRAPKLRADLEHNISPLKLLIAVIQAKPINLQSPRRAHRIGEHRYATVACQLSRG